MRTTTAGVTWKGNLETNDAPHCGLIGRADRLRSLQGECIPVLYGCGFWDNGWTYFLATSIVAGEHPGSGTCGGRQAAERVGVVCRGCE
jgi:hypothetical protein